MARTNLTKKQKGVIAGAVIAVVAFLASEIPGVLSKERLDTWSEFIFRNPMSYAPSMALILGSAFAHIVFHFGQPDTYRRDFMILLSIWAGALLIDLAAQLVYKFLLGNDGWIVYHEYIIAGYAVVGVVLGLLFWRQDALRYLLRSAS